MEALFLKALAAASVMFLVAGFDWRKLPFVELARPVLRRGFLGRVRRSPRPGLSPTPPFNDLLHFYAVKGYRKDQNGNRVNRLQWHAMIQARISSWHRTRFFLAIFLQHDLICYLMICT